MKGVPTEELERASNELVTANHILANENIFDGYGHVSVRHPGDPARFLLSCSRAPALVVRSDLLEFDLAGRPLHAEGRRPYAETAIHAAIYEARPDVQAVVHSHAYELLPFAATGAPLRPVIHVSGCIGSRIPSWDIREHFGDTDMLVRTMEHGRSLAQALGAADVAMMLGHGSVIVGSALRRSVLTSVYLVVNARVQSVAMQMGGAPRFMSEGEVALTTESSFAPGSIDRMWEYWLRRLEGRPNQGNEAALP